MKTKTKKATLRDLIDFLKTKHEDMSPFDQSKLQDLEDNYPRLDELKTELKKVQASVMRNHENYKKALELNKPERLKELFREANDNHWKAENIMSEIRHSKYLIKTAEESLYNSGYVNKILNQRGIFKTFN